MKDMNMKMKAFRAWVIGLTFAWMLSVGALAQAQAQPLAAGGTAAEGTASEMKPVLQTNSALLVIGVGAVVVIGLGALALAAYTSQQAAQGIPLPAFVELIKTILDAGARVALPIGADLASRTPNKLDDLAIAEIAKASGWGVEVDPETGKIILTPPQNT